MHNRLFIQNHSIRTIIILVLLLLILPFNILLIIVTYKSNHEFFQSISTYDESILNIYGVKASEEMDRIENYITNGIASSNSISNASSASAPVTISSSLQRWLSEYNAMMLNLEFETHAFVYDVHTGRITYSYTDPISKNMQDDLCYMYENNGNTVTDDWKNVTVGGFRYLYISYMYKERLILGSVISIKSITNNVSQTFAYKTIYSDIVTSKKLPEIKTNRLLLSVPLGTTDLSLWFSVQNSEIQARIPAIQYIIIIITALLIFLIPTMYFALKKLVLHPLVRINSALMKARNGEVDYRISDQHNYAREFRYINNSFNEMIDSILQLKMKNYENKIIMQRHELLNLQLQIKPHFLYNTFNDISSLATIKDYNGIQKMMKNLSDYFRYSVRTGYELIPFYRELNFLDAYISIMNIRYVGCFEYRCNIEDGLENCLIPPLLIHTFVENIMTHIVKVGSFVMINVNARKDKDCVIVEITDDGEGMSENILKQIEDKKKVTDEFGKEHIGIWNCYKRLEIFYKGKASLDVFSEEAVGTIVTIKIPYSDSSKIEKHNQLAEE